VTLPNSLPPRYLPKYRPILGALILAAVVLAIYGASAGFEFVYDDHVQIERNPWLRDPDGFRMFLIHPFWGFYADRGALPSNYYRPAFGWAYSLVARAFGLQPAPFHVVSVALHLAITLLVALGAWRLAAAGGERKREIAALAAGLFFAVYPAHAEAVAWIGDQADLLTALFALLALAAYVSHKDRGGWVGWTGPVAYLFACLCKEPGAALILVLGAVEMAEWRREGSLGAALRRGAARLAPYVAAAGVYLALRLHALGSFSPRSYGVTATPAGSVAFAAGLLARYLAFLAVPFPARVLTSVPAPPLLSGVAIAGLAAATLLLLGLASAAWNGRMRREIFLPLAVIVAFLLPVLAANSIGGANFSERYVYLPSIGLSWLIGLLASWLAGVLSGRVRIVAAAAGLAMLAGLGAAAWARSEVYHDDLSLFRAAARTAPYSEIARNNLGMALYNRGRIDEAEREYQQALRLEPTAVPPLANLAVLYEKRGDAKRAEATFQSVLRLAPTHTIAVVHLARFERKRGDLAGAARRLDALFAAGGESYDALVERADLQLEAGHPERALPLLDRAVHTFPDYAHGWGLLARARAARGDRAGAAEAAHRALAIDPKNQDARKVLGGPQVGSLQGSVELGAVCPSKPHPRSLSNSWRGRARGVSAVSVREACAECSSSGTEEARRRCPSSGEIRLYGPSLSTPWRGTEGEASKGRSPQNGSPS
jgi:tetratricopeptide (TPR) repeat protein